MTENEKGVSGPSAGGDPAQGHDAGPVERASDGTELEARVVSVLQTVYDPEIPVNIYELGLVYDVVADAEKGRVEVTMTLTTPHCPVAGTMPGMVEERLRGVDGVRDVTVNLVWDPPWTPDRMSEAARLELGL